MPLCPPSDVVEFCDAEHTFPAAVHVGVRLDEQNARVPDFAVEDLAVPLDPAEQDAQLVQDMVNGHKTRVVAVVPVLVAYIAEADDHIVDSGLFSLKKLVELHRTTLVKE